MHLAHVEVHLLERPGHLLHLEFRRGEDDDALQLLGFEERTDDAQLLRFMADVGSLHNLVSRTRHGQLHLHGIGQDMVSQLLNLVGHGSREHDGLAALRQQFGNLHDVVVEAHIEHTVGLIENEERHTRQVHVAHLQVGQQSARCGNHHVSSQRQSAFLLFKEYAVVSAIDSHAAYRHEVGKALHLLVNLLRQLACGCHDDAVDGIFGVSALREAVDYG